MGHFLVKSKEKLSDLEIGAEIPESDFATLTPEGLFVQLEYKEEERTLEPYKVTPGIWAIQKTMSGLRLFKTSFTEDSILDSFVQTKEVNDKIDCFFNRLEVYKKRKIEIPVRRILLFGPPGTGKTTSISIAARKYEKDNETAIIVWHTDKFEAHTVKDFFKSFEYIGVKKVILVMEDIGGGQSENRRGGVESSLLSLLDNQEKTFTIPTLIIATSNYPENLLGSITNRPGRFSDKIKVGYPDAKAKQELLKFFAQDSEVTQELLDLIASTACKEFSADHLKEIFLRADLYDKTAFQVTKDMIEEVKLFNKNFEEGNSRMGIHHDD